MPSPDPIAIRVARRHAAAHDLPMQGTRIERLDIGRITSAELTRSLEPIVGPLSNLLFHRPPGDPTNTIGWAAVDPTGDVVSGMLEVHVALTDDEARNWAEVTIDPPGSSVLVDPDHLRLIEPASRSARDVQRRLEGLVEVGGGEGEDPEDDVGGGLDSSRAKNHLRAAHR